MDASRDASSVRRVVCATYSMSSTMASLTAPSPPLCSDNTEPLQYGKAISKARHSDHQPDLTCRSDGNHHRCGHACLLLGGGVDDKVRSDLGQCHEHWCKHKMNASGGGGKGETHRESWQPGDSVCCEDPQTPHSPSVHQRHCLSSQPTPQHTLKEQQHIQM